jgi:hypothetical protein
VEHVPVWSEDEDEVSFLRQEYPAARKLSREEYENTVVYGDRTFSVL